MNTNNYKKTIVILSSVIIFAASLTIASFFIKSLTRIEDMERTPPNTDEYYTANAFASQEKQWASETIGGDEERYLVTVYDGKIGVFKNGETIPFMTCEIPVYMLPERDIDILEAGILAHSLSEVNSILEDYE